MNTPFEDLEYLADYLPEEGEAMLVTRRDGELICEPFREDSTRDGVSDPELYGRLIQASERLNLLSTMPLWVCLVGWFWLCVAFHLGTGIGWSGWYLDVGTGIMTLMGGLCWIHFRQRRLFEQEVQPMLEREIHRSGLQQYVLIGAIRQHPEMRPLMDELSRWTDRDDRLGPLEL